MGEIWILPSAFLNLLGNRDFKIHFVLLACLIFLWLDGKGSSEVDLIV